MINEKNSELHISAWFKKNEEQWDNTLNLRSVKFIFKDSNL